MRLGLYTRISVDPNGTSDATERQEDACRSWAERNGHECTRLYTDRDISGYKDVQRPGFAAVLASVEIPAHLWPEWFHIKDMRDYHAQLSLCRSDTHSPAQSFFSPSNR